MASTISSAVGNDDTYLQNPDIRRPREDDAYPSERTRVDDVLYGIRNTVELAGNGIVLIMDILSMLRCYLGGNELLP